MDMMEDRNTFVYQFSTDALAACGTSSQGISSMAVVVNFAQNTPGSASGQEDTFLEFCFF